MNTSRLVSQPDSRVNKVLRRDVILHQCSLVLVVTARQTNSDEENSVFVWGL